MASSAAASTTFVFREQKVVLIKTEQLVKLHGPWPTGRGTFKRGKTSVNNIVHDESAAHMLERIEKSAAQAEVRARPAWRTRDGWRARGEWRARGACV